MKYSNVNGERREAERGLLGSCPACGHPTIAKCGEVMVHHWAHKSGKICDSFHENETPWHRAWKNLFPVQWQEIVQFDDQGEKHIADVKTDQGWVLEFQHSFLNPEERRKRDAFYRKIVWIVDGTRRKTDIAQFEKAFQQGAWHGANNLIRKIDSDICRLMREWNNSPSPVFFHFGERERIWWLLPDSPNGRVLVSPFLISSFVDLHGGGDPNKVQDFEKFLSEFSDLVRKYNTQKGFR